MIALLQRVTEAQVSVDGREIAAIGPGMLGLLGIERGDSATNAGRMADRLLKFRMFPDPAGRMNLDIAAAGGELLLVPQFTLAADTDAGHRPSFSRAADPDQARHLFEILVGEIEQRGQPVQTGRFGANMQVSSINDGPVTFTLRVQASHS